MAAAGAGAALWPVLSPGLAALERRPPNGQLRLRTGKGTAPLLGADSTPVQVWSYNGEVPGPELRFRQGDRLKVVVENCSCCPGQKMILACPLVGLIYPGQKFFKLIRQLLSGDYEPKRVADALKLALR